MIRLASQKSENASGFEFFAYKPCICPKIGHIHSHRAAGRIRPTKFRIGARGRETLFLNLDTRTKKVLLGAGHAREQARKGSMLTWQPCTPGSGHPAGR